MSARVIVGFDGSSDSRTALQWAVQEAQLLDRPVRVITACEFDRLAYPPDARSAVSDQRRRQAADAVARATAARRAVGVDIQIVDGTPAKALLDAAHAADLIVVGSSGAGRSSRFLLGSTVAEVLHRSPCPVAVTPPTLGRAFDRIAVGVDGSPTSDLALTAAIAEAELRKSTVTIAHVWEYPYGLTAEGVGRRSDATEVDAGIVLDRAVETARDLTALPLVRCLVEGRTVERLLELGAESDLLVLGSRGRGSLASMVLGSVTLATSARAACPVLVVPNR
jgi:nucleotide-binding universal stress UspA family protein